MVPLQTLCVPLKHCNTERGTNQQNENGTKLLFISPTTTVSVTKPALKALYIDHIQDQGTNDAGCTDDCTQKAEFQTKSLKL